jgi:polyhydroxybutyrate depolymerase
MRKKLLVLVLLTLVLAPCLAARADRHELGERSYLLHVPANLKSPAPLLLALHGGGGNAAQFERWTKLSQLADREGFLVAYPEGVGHNWNDGRTDVQAQAFRDKVDDVAFLRAVVEDVAREHQVDKTRVYATGVSNGGFMSSRLGIEAPDLVAAIAPVVGGIAEGLPAPSKPVGVLIIQGTEDPLVPYGGGTVAKTRGRLIPTEEAVRRWCAANGCAKATRRVIDTADDGCSIELADYGAVRFYKVIGGGHTLPGARQYLPERWIGKTSQDMNGAEVIWAFLSAHRR